MKNWISPEALLTPVEYRQFLDSALSLKKKGYENNSDALKNKTVYFMFFNQSLRTRSSFQTGLAKLGGIPIVLDPGSGIYTPALPGREIPYSTERISDVARVLSGYGDGIAIRMYGAPTGWVYGEANRAIEEFARWSSIPVINMECDMFHPCQALADMMTIREKYGKSKKKIVVSWAYSGSWHKPVAVPQSVLLAAANCELDLVLAHPPGFELDENVVKLAAAKAHECGSTFEISNDFEKAVTGADIVYAKSWCSLQCLPKLPGSAVDEERMNRLFEDNKHWTYDTSKHALTNADSIYMHCLPADRGQEVTDEILDGSSSAVFSQATNRLHAQNAVMLNLLGPNSAK